jgi:hypothetical protein
MVNDSDKMIIFKKNCEFKKKSTDFSINSRKNNALNEDEIKSSPKGFEKFVLPMYFIFY